MIALIVSKMDPVMSKEICPKQRLATTVAENHKESKETVHHKVKKYQNPLFLHIQSRADSTVVYHF